MGNYASVIRAKMKDIKECVETLFFHIRWILAHGEIALLYAEDLSVYVRRRHRFHPADHRKLGDISDKQTKSILKGNHDVSSSEAPFVDLHVKYTTGRKLSTKALRKTSALYSCILVSTSK